jgi:hypothetical protein
MTKGEGTSRERGLAESPTSTCARARLKVQSIKAAIVQLFESGPNTYVLPPTPAYRTRSLLLTRLRVDVLVAAAAGRAAALAAARRHVVVRVLARARQPQSTPASEPARTGSSSSSSSSDAASSSSSKSSKSSSSSVSYSSALPVK